MKVHGGGDRLELFPETPADDEAVLAVLNGTQAGAELLYFNAPSERFGGALALQVVAAPRRKVTFGGEAEGAMLAPVGAFGERRGLIRNRLKDRVVKAAVAKGYSAAEAERAFEDGWVSSDRPFIDWFVNGGFEKLLEIVLNLLKLFAESE